MENNLQTLNSQTMEINKSVDSEQLLSIKLQIRHLSYAISICYRKDIVGLWGKTTGIMKTLNKLRYRCLFYL